MLFSGHKVRLFIVLLVAKGTIAVGKELNKHQSHRLSYSLPDMGAHREDISKKLLLITHWKLK